MADAPDLTAAIVENATSAQSVTTRDGSVMSNNLRDQIEAAHFLAASAAVSLDPFAAMRPRKMIPPASVSPFPGGGP